MPLWRLTGLTMDWQKADFGITGPKGTTPKFQLVYSEYKSFAPKHLEHSQYIMVLHRPSSAAVTNPSAAAYLGTYVAAYHHSDESADRSGGVAAYCRATAYRDAVGYCIPSSYRCACVYCRQFACCHHFANRAPAAYYERAAHPGRQCSCLWGLHSLFQPSCLSMTSLLIALQAIYCVAAVFDCSAAFCYWSAASPIPVRPQAIWVRRPPIPVQLPIVALYVVPYPNLKFVLYIVLYVSYYSLFTLLLALLCNYIFWNDIYSLHGIFNS